MQHNNILTIILPGPPVPKARAKSGRRGFYNPQRDIMNIVKVLIKQQLPGDFKMITERVPVVVNIKAFFSPSKTESTKKFLDLIKDEAYPSTKKKDRDNLDKFVLDCMSGIIFYDDAQVYDGRITKLYTPNEPRTEIEILWQS